LIYDMEGISGIDNYQMTAYRYRDAFARGQELLAGDVNAVVDGLFAGGAAEVAVLDFHGSGVPSGINLPIDKLDKRARMLTKRVMRTPAWWWEQGTFDAVAFVGMHGGPGSGGFLAHRSSAGGETILNGISISETEGQALQAGEHPGLPVIFDAGDDVLKADVAHVMPWVEYVEVKRTINPGRAELIPLSVVHPALREGARRAISRIAQAKVMRLRVPATVTYRATPPADLAPLIGIPGLTIHSDSGVASVTFTAADFDHAMAGAAAFANVAQTLGYDALELGAIRRLPSYARIQDEIGDPIRDRWIESETKLARRRH
jgi:D-amino peptidase